MQIGGNYECSITCGEERTIADQVIDENQDENVKDYEWSLNKLVCLGTSVGIQMKGKT